METKRSKTKRGWDLRSIHLFYAKKIGKERLKSNLKVKQTNQLKKIHLGMTLNP